MNMMTAEFSTRKNAMHMNESSSNAAIEADSMISSRKQSPFCRNINVMNVSRSLYLYRRSFSSVIRRRSSVPIHVTAWKLGWLTVVDGVIERHPGRNYGLGLHILRVSSTLRFDLLNFFRWDGVFFILVLPGLVLTILASALRIAIHPLVETDLRK